MFRGTRPFNSAARRLAALYRSWGKPAEAARYQAALSGTSDSPAAARTP